MRNYCLNLRTRKRSFTSAGVAVLLRGQFVCNIIQHGHSFITVIVVVVVVVVVIKAAVVVVVVSSSSSSSGSK